jgi:hypothetical protein
VRRFRCWCVANRWTVDIQSVLIHSRRSLRRRPRDKIWSIRHKRTRRIHENLRKDGKKWTFWSKSCDNTSIQARMFHPATTTSGNDISMSRVTSRVVKWRVLLLRSNGFEIARRGDLQSLVDSDLDIFLHHRLSIRRICKMRYWIALFFALWPKDRNVSEVYMRKVAEQGIRQIWSVPSFTSRYSMMTGTNLIDH